MIRYVPSESVKSRPTWWRWVLVVTPEAPRVGSPGAAAAKVALTLSQVVAPVGPPFELHHGGACWWCRWGRCCAGCLCRREPWGTSVYGKRRIACMSMSGFVYRSRRERTACSIPSVTVAPPTSSVSLAVTVWMVAIRSVLAAMRASRGCDQAYSRGWGTTLTCRRCVCPW
jgi:hypothetical protein